MPGLLSAPMALLQNVERTWVGYWLSNIYVHVHAAYGV